MSHEPCHQGNSSRNQDPAGGPLLLRRKAPLTRRSVAYFCSGAHNHLKGTNAKRILVSAIFDPSALGALQAFKDADRLEDCAIVGQNGSIEALLQMRKPNSRLIGSVAYFPERYGEQLMGLTSDILAKRSPIPNAVFIKHQLLTAGNIKQHYEA